MTITPIHYDITIKTFFPTAFAGTAEIKLHLDEPSDSIELNTAAPLRLLSAVAVLTTGERFAPSSFQEDVSREITKLQFGTGIRSGEVTLGLRWTGRLDDGTLQGYYRIPCKDGSWYTATQFQPTTARRAFPCFDHPAKKATFSLTLVYPSSMSALSNTPISSKLTSAECLITQVISADFLEGKEGALKDDKEDEAMSDEELVWEAVTFQPTPKMPTYLLAWAIGNFSSITSSYVSPLTNATVPLALYASTPFQHVEKGQGQLALDSLARIMPLYEEIFDVPYPLEKLDLLVCDAFDAGAMENFGIIFGKTSTLLHDPASSGVTSLFKVVVTVAHEAAHMWFGNMVSMGWWSELWLNEGFATLMGEVVALDRLEPSWHVHSAFIKFHRATALELDALRSSHPVQMPYEEDEKKVIQAFDTISYRKGCCVLRMLSDLVGEKNFLHAISKYIKANLFGTVTANDLWKVMPDVSGVPAVEIMDAWVTKTGFPIITVTETSKGLLLRQNRFLASADPSPEEDSTLWPVPLKIKVFGKTELDQQVIMSTREMLVPMSGEAMAGIYTINGGTSGMFRVAYPAEFLARLAIEAGKIDTLLPLPDRIGMLQDVICLSEAGYISTTTSLDFILHLTSEPEHLVWTEIAFAFRRLLDVWWEQPAPVLEGIKAFARKLFGPVMESLGFVHREEDDTDTRLKRILVFACSAAAEVPSVIVYIKHSYLLLSTGQSDPNSGDFANVVVAEAVRHGGVMEYEIALAIYNQPPTPQHQIAAIVGLTSTRVPELVQRTAGLLASGKVEEQNMPYFFMGLTANPCTRRLVWDYVRATWSSFEVQFRGSYNLGNLVQSSFQNLSSGKDAEEVRAFFAEKDCSTFNQSLEQGLETVLSKSAWLSRDAPLVEAWLKEKGFMQPQPQPQSQKVE